MAADDEIIDLNTIRTLYSNKLYSIDKQEKKSEPASEKISPKKILILLREHVIPGDPLYIFLQGILGACRLQMNDVNMIVSFRQDGDYQQLISAYGASFVLMFGVEAADIKLPVFFPQYQVQGHNGVNYISSPDLAIIENDKPSKQKLWQSLKKAFSI
ncbi:MAG TPA: hypothetical protein VK166_16960 [Chitinophagaceae bacterium]|nr:hypothetical protein [Chitinophagaceae bacterium]